MPSEMNENLDRLKKITKADLAKQFEYLKDCCEASVNEANRCDINFALKDIAYAEMAAHRLREDAIRHWLDGDITPKEYEEISKLSTSLIFENLSQEVANAVVYSCECVKGGSLSKN